jgi:hypothetical protein
VSLDKTGTHRVVNTTGILEILLELLSSNTTLLYSHHHCQPRGSERSKGSHPYHLNTLTKAKRPSQKRDQQTATRQCQPSSPFQCSGVGNQTSNRNLDILEVLNSAPNRQNSGKSGTGWGYAGLASGVENVTFAGWLNDNKPLEIAHEQRRAVERTLQIHRT